jgi:hypothetical protein
LLRSLCRSMSLMCTQCGEYVEALSPTQDYLGTIHADVRFQAVCAISFVNDWNNM